VTEIEEPLLLFDNNTVINYFDDRARFIYEVETLDNKIKRQIKTKLDRDEAEIDRIAREYNYRNYGKRYKQDIDIVLGSLLGALVSEKALSKHNFR
jgi:tetrahydromethanopterin S-methyltransferase subunit G